MGLPILDNHLSLQHGRERSSERGYEFLEQSKGLYKRIAVYNSISYNKHDNEVFKYFEDNIYPSIEKYSIDGFVVTSLPLATKLKQDFPHLELHSSCNCFQWSVRQMNLWREIAGVDVFNPPREAAKTPSMLKEMSEAGFKLKVLVNEACVYGCPYTINHACSVAEQKSVFTHCIAGDYANALRTNLFLPSWLESIDEYVYCFKLSGRESSYTQLKNILDAYIKQVPFEYIDEFATFGSNSVITELMNREIRIKVSDIPDKTRYCEAKECNKTCFLCSSLMNRINPM
jgi:collagenase-like PrtC family protease